MRYRVIRMSAMRCIALLTAALTLASARAESPPPVLVTTADEVGQGFLMTRLDRCLAVTAAHVMKERTRASLVGSDNDRALDGDAVLVAADAVADVAVLEVSGPLAHHCGSDFVLGASADTLRGNAAAVLAHVPRSGKLGREPLIVVDVREKDLIVAPAPGHDATLGGFSGSLITVDDRPAAMILSVVGAKGESRAIRYDRLVSMAREMADAHPRPASVPSVGTAAGTRRKADIDFASQADGARVLRWSSPPTKPEFSASNLVSQTNDLPWEVPSSAPPAKVDIALAGDSVVAVSSVTTSIGRISTDKLPTYWEIQTSVDGESWVLAFSGVFQAVEGEGRAVFPPRRARYLRLRLGARTDVSQPIVSIGRLSVH